MLTVLLWKNLIYDRLRFAIAVAGVTFAAFLMTIQADLLYGFTKAASRVVEATDAAIWIMPRGVPCFDYSAVMPEQIRELAYGVPGVARTGRIASGFTVLKTETGFRQAALLIGVDDEFAGGVPVPVKLTPGGIHYLESATIDATDFHLLKTPKLPSELEAGMQRLRVMHLAEGFASFLGSPYVFVSYRDAKRYLGVPEEQTMFVLVQTQPEADPVQIRDALRLRLPEFDVLLKEEFMLQARIFWLVQTGAGGALSLAAILGFFIGLAVVSQTIYAATVEHLEEYATLKALGASNGKVRFLVLGQAVICGTIGTVLGFLAVPPAVNLAKEWITWIAAPVWMFGVVAAALGVLCSVAALVAVQPAIAVDPGRVFRA